MKIDIAKGLELEVAEEGVSIKHDPNRYITNEEMDKIISAYNDWRYLNHMWSQWFEAASVANNWLQQWTRWRILGVEWIPHFNIYAVHIDFNGEKRTIVNNQQFKDLQDEARRYRNTHDGVGVTW